MKTTTPTERPALASPYEGHTKGPWRAEKDQTGRTLAVTGPSDTPDDNTREPVLCSMYDSDYTNLSEREANCRLMADAPMLLTQRDALAAALFKLKNFTENARSWARDGKDAEAVAELLGNYCKKLIKQSGQALAQVEGGQQP